MFQITKKVTVYVRSFFVVVNAAVPPQFYNCASKVGAKRVCHSNVMSGLVSYKKNFFLDTWYNFIKLLGKLLRAYLGV